MYVCYGVYVCVFVGYLYITGRIKELLITRGGENIAPVPIEERMLNSMKLLSNCMVIGDNQKYLTMLVTLRTEVCVWVMSVQIPLSKISVSKLKSLSIPAFVRYCERG